MKIDGWHIIDEPGLDVLATKQDVAWAYVNEAGGYPTLDVRHCDETSRASIPVDVVDSLLAAWRRKRVTKP